MKWYETSAGQRVLIIKSWLCRAVMTVAAEVPAMGVEMCEVGMLRVQVFRSG